MDLISSNLQATNEKFNSILSGLESTKADALANLETAAATATAAISSKLESVTGDLRSLVPEGFSVPNVNLQGQLQSLSGLTDVTQSANLLSSITADFGDALSASGFSLDTLVSDAASAFGSGDSLSGLVPNFERSPLGDVIQKANAVKLADINPVVEEASTFTQNTEVLLQSLLHQVRFVKPLRLYPQKIALPIRLRRNLRKLLNLREDNL